MSERERVAWGAIRDVLRASIRFYESEREKSEGIREAAFCTGAITALLIFEKTLEKGFESEKG